MISDDNYYNRYRNLNYSKKNRKTSIQAVQFELWNEFESRPKTAVLKITTYHINCENEVKILKEASAIEENIVKYYYSYRKSCEFYIFMEFCHRGSLHDFIEDMRERNITLDQDKFVSMCLQSLKILENLHNHNIYHRDIKPDNILVSENDILKFCDLGESKITTAEKNTIKGTVVYMSPYLKNVYSGKKCSFVSKYDINPGREDIWSLGKTFVELAIASSHLDFHKWSISQIRTYVHDQLAKINKYNYWLICVLIEMLNDTNPNGAPYKTIANYIETFESIQNGVNMNIFQCSVDSINTVISSGSFSESISDAFSLLEESKSSSNISGNKPNILKATVKMPSENEKILIIPNPPIETEKKVPMKTPSIAEYNFSKRELSPNTEDPNHKTNENSVTYGCEQERNSKFDFSSKKSDHLSLEKTFNTESTIDSKFYTAERFGDKKCCKCAKQILAGKEIILACKHCYHFDCLNEILEGQLENAESYKDIYCQICILPIKILRLKVLPCFKGYKEKYELFVSQYPVSCRNKYSRII